MKTRPNYLNRQKRLADILISKGLDALLIKKKENIFYLTGSRGEDSLLVASRSGIFVVTDARYSEEYKKSARNSSVVTTGIKNTLQCVYDILKKSRAARVGFEADNLTCSEFTALKKYLRKTRLVPAERLVESLRIIKDSHEIECIKKACVYGCQAMSYSLKNLAYSHTENSLKQKIEGWFLKKGFWPAGFETIVASGRNSSMPHALATDKKIRRGEMVVIDLGVRNYGYNSDLTRTVYLGRIERIYSRVYNVVLDAQKKAIDNIRPGVKASFIDNISRKYINDKGFGRYFIHSTGHGIGLETHEAPGLFGKSNVVLAQGMTMTVEPGIYIPGWGGVRIEDVILVTKNGCEALTGGNNKALCR